MEAIELNLQINENGEVHLPKKYQRLFGKQAKLLLLLPDKSESLHKRRCPGSAKGILEIVSEDDEHLDDFREYMP
ncbi:MAG: hypothetical protein HQM10_26900 [Candidatus Riflebacteria bacterium]|nr:hypothetical protein [Candidatus Riflebacteria bacterium]